jgi:hypothetical protein
MVYNDLTKTSKQTEQLLESFYRFFTHLKIEKSYEMCNIFNMNKTPVWFNMAGNFTVNQTGEKMVTFVKQIMKKMGSLLC